MFRNLLTFAMGVALAISLCVAGCRGRTVQARPTAVATIFAYYDALRAIGGPDVDCRIMLPPRTSPHEYEPTVADRAAVARASLIIRNGLQIDLWVDKMSAQNKSARVIDISKVVEDRGIAPLGTEEVSVTPDGESRPAGHEDVSAGNPHIWLDPRVQGMAAEAIRDALIEIDPAHKEGYTARANAYLQDLGKLDQDFRQAAEGFRQKEFIGFHLAYDYLARRYGLKEVAAVEELPGQGPSPAQQKKIIELIRDKHVKVLFMESALPARAADRIIQETGVRTGILQPLETYDSAEQTYVSLMRQNLRSLKDALD